MILKQSSGFTLIETLVAVTLLAVISMLLWQSAGTLTNAKSRFDEEDSVFHESTLALNRIADDLSMTFLVSPQDRNLLGQLPSGEAATKVVFVGKNNGDQDEILFNAFSNIRYLKNMKQSDQATLAYRLQRDEESEEGSYQLRVRNASPIGPNPAEGGVEYTLLRGVKTLNFRYYDGNKNEWVDEWSTEGVDFANRLPLAVEITLSVEDPIYEGESLKFATITRIELAPDTLSFSAASSSSSAPPTPPAPEGNP